MKMNWGYVAGLGFYMAAAAVATQVYHVGGDKGYQLLFWLGALGITSTAFLVLFHQKWDQRKQKAQDAAQQALGGGGGSAGAAAAATPEAGEAAGEVDGLVKDAEARLGASRQGVKLSDMPVIFMLGERGSTKTTVMMQSGMEPELLGGQIYQQDNMIAPTRSVNIWFVRKAVFVETGGPLWGDSTGWTRLLKKLAPGKMTAVFGKKGSAPRAAVLCIDIEKFLQPGASDAMAMTARGIQARLQEFSNLFGISFPVYIFFTRTDRLPFFHDFVANLSSEEATQVFGVTLPLKGTRGGVYAEEETRRLNEYFNELFHSLCDKRIEFLPRENDAEKLPGCYEFPREFRKLRASLVQFLVDVGRPSQLSTSPFLRGFYFTGVRPVFINDVGANPVFQQPAKQSYDPGGGATRMFSVGDYGMPQQVPVAAPQQPGGRKVPQWVFLSHLFNDVILEDKAALGASEASTKTSGLRRILLGSLAALGLIWSMGMTYSFFQNRSLERNAIDATSQIKSVRLAANALPSIDDLRRLDSLRQQLEQLTVWKKKGAPWGYRWGLYVGDDLLPAVRKAYYDCFNQLLLSDTQRRMLDFLRSRPAKAAETDDYSYAYETLRAHLVTTSEWKRDDTDEEAKRLAGTLLARWSQDRDSSIGEERKALSDTQFRFYAGDLRNGNPFSVKEDAEGADRARIYLASFSGFERFYNTLIAEANKRNPLVNFNARYPGSSQVVINNRDVPGAFTKEGWAFMQTAFKNRGKGLGGEEWVLLSSKYKSAGGIPENLDELLRRRYRDDYVKAWREYFVKTAVLVPYPNASVAVTRLGIHSSPSAPILALIGLASYHTYVDPAGDPYVESVRKAFEWPRAVVPPSKEAYITGGNRPYLDGLGSLKDAIELAARLTQPDQVALATIDLKKSDAMSKAHSVAAFTSADSEGRLDQHINRILEAPIRGVEGLFSPVDALNREGKGLCDAFNMVVNKFPFNPTAEPEVSVNELNELLRPGSGKLSQLADKLKQGGVKVNPAFDNFFRQVKALSDAFYRSGADPQLSYSIQFIEAVNDLEKKKYTTGNVAIDGKAAALGGAAVNYLWNGSPHTAVLVVENDTKNRKQGMWAIFRLFVEANLTPQGGNYLLAYPLISGREKYGETRFVVNLNGAPPVFDRRFFTNLPKCNPTVALK